MQKGVTAGERLDPVAVSEIVVQIVRAIRS
jgi:hypothetical protein